MSETELPRENAAAPAAPAPASEPAAEAAEPASAPDELAPPGLEDPLAVAWAALQSTWDDEARHKAFVALASGLGRLPDAGARYREAAGDEARRAMTERGKQLVLAQALAQLEALPRTERQPKGLLLAPLATLGFLFAMNFLAATIAHSRVFVSLWVFAIEVALVLVIPWRRLQRSREG